MPIQSNVTTIDLGNDKTKITFSGENNIFKDLAHTAMTINDDPGNHKKKALLGAVGSAGGAYAVHKTLGPLLQASFTNKIPGAPVSRPVSLVSTLLSAATPAAIYYAIQNRDRKERSAAGAAIAAGSAALNLAIPNQLEQQSGQVITPEVDNAIKDQLAGLAPSLTFTAGSVAYTLHQLQAAENAERLKKIVESQTTPRETKIKEVNRIINKNDMFVRYPLLRSVPFSGELRTIYNNYHQPSSEMSDEDIKKYKIE